MARIPSRFFCCFGALLLCAVGCAAESNDGRSDSDTGGSSGSAGTSASAGAPPTESTCQSGTSCSCPGGERGQVECDGDTPRCACPDCVEFPPVPATISFEPCGGAPEGNWRMGGYDLSGVVIGYVTSLVDTSKSVMCEVEVQLDGEPPYLSWQLNADGTAIISHHPPRISMKLDEACPKAVLGHGCENIVNCQDAGCGECLCYPEQRRATVDMNATYTRNDASLRFGALEFEYCVKGDSMLVRDTLDRTKYELERIPEPRCSGTPAPCSINKSQRDCQLVAGCKPQGVCSSSQNAACQNIKNPDQCMASACTWTFTACAGEPANLCENISVEECRFTPGCRVTP